MGIGPALKRGTGASNGRPAVVLAIQKQPDANTLELTRELETVLDGIAATLPGGTVLHQNLFNQADFITRSTDNVIHSLRDR